MYEYEKMNFLNSIKHFATDISGKITKNDEWTIRGFIDVFKNVYSLSSDTKIISKILEIHLFPLFLSFADKIDYEVEPAEKQNYYPDLTFISKKNKRIKFAVDLKTTYRELKRPNYCNGFTLGSHGEYFVNRNSKKNIQYPYNEYSGHFCLGIIYSRVSLNRNIEFNTYSLDNLSIIPAIIKDLTFFAEEKWKIAADKSGSGNTANIGSIKFIDDIIAGNGVFALAGEEYFDDYWINYGKLIIKTSGKNHKKLSSFDEYLNYRGLPLSLNNKQTDRGDRDDN